VVQSSLPCTACINLRRINYFLLVCSLLAVDLRLPAAGPAAQVIQSLAHPGTALGLRAVVDAHFARDALMKNPLFTVRGRDNM
jgi:hypothetical protein